MHKVVLDTNVLISAIVFGGKPRDVFNRILKGQIRLAISKDILDEMEGVLSGKKVTTQVHFRQDLRDRQDY